MTDQTINPVPDITPEEERSFWRRLEYLDSLADLNGGGETEKISE